MLERG